MNSWQNEWFALYEGNGISIQVLKNVKLITNIIYFFVMPCSAVNSHKLFDPFYGEPTSGPHSRLISSHSFSLLVLVQAINILLVRNCPKDVFRDPLWRYGDIDKRLPLLVCGQSLHYFNGVSQL